MSILTALPGLCWKYCLTKALCSTLNSLSDLPNNLVNTSGFLLVFTLCNKVAADTKFSPVPIPTSERYSTGTYLINCIASCTPPST